MTNSNPHWTDARIEYIEEENAFVAFEYGKSPIGSYSSRDAARDALVISASTLNIPERIITVSGYDVDLKRVQMVEPNIPHPKDKSVVSFDMMLVSGKVIKDIPGELRDGIVEKYRKFIKSEQLSSSPWTPLIYHIEVEDNDQYAKVIVGRNNFGVIVPRHEVIDAKTSRKYWEFQCSVDVQLSFATDNDNRDECVELTKTNIYNWLNNCFA